MTGTSGWLMAEGRIPDTKAWLGQTELDMWPYRDRTVALLRRYGADVSAVDDAVTGGGCRSSPR